MGALGSVAAAMRLVHHSYRGVLLYLIRSQRSNPFILLLLLLLPPPLLLLYALDAVLLSSFSASFFSCPLRDCCEDAECSRYFRRRKVKIGRSHRLCDGAARGQKRAADMKATQGKMQYA